MSKADTDLIALNRAAHAKALTAAALRLREDRRIMAMPKMRDELADLAALIAIGSATVSVSHQRLAGISRDPATFQAYRECQAAAIEAAKKAVEGIDIRKPEPKK